MAPPVTLPPSSGSVTWGSCAFLRFVEKTKDPRVVVTWELAAGIASVLHELAWWLGVRAQRSRIVENVLRSGVDPEGRQPLEPASKLARLSGRSG